MAPSNDAVAKENEEICSLQLELLDSAKRELVNFRKEPQNRLTITVYNRRIENLNEYRIEFRKYHNRLIRNGLAKMMHISQKIYAVHSTTRTGRRLRKFKRQSTTRPLVIQTQRIPITTIMATILTITTTVEQSQSNWNAISRS